MVSRMDLKTEKIPNLNTGGAPIKSLGLDRYNFWTSFGEFAQSKRQIATMKYHSIRKGIIGGRKHHLEYPTDIPPPSSLSPSLPAWHLIVPSGSWQDARLVRRLLFLQSLLPQKHTHWENIFTLNCLICRLAMKRAPSWMQVWHTEHSSQCHAAYSLHFALHLAMPVITLRADFLSVSMRAVDWLNDMNQAVFRLRCVVSGNCWFALRSNRVVIVFLDMSRVRQGRVDVLGSSHQPRARSAWVSSAPSNISPDRTPHLHPRFHTHSRDNTHAATLGTQHRSKMSVRLIVVRGCYVYVCVCVGGRGVMRPIILFSFAIFVGHRCLGRTRTSSASMLSGEYGSPSGWAPLI